MAKEMLGGCCVCSDERGWAENPLVYCDGRGCNVAVHQACYGIVQVPTGPWFCRKCESQERSARVRCELCPSKDGALKRTDNSGWAHVVCALYIPEVRFGNVTTMEPIILQLVPPDRYSKNCYICEEQGSDSDAVIGACMQCNKSGCKQYFHVTCAQASGLLCEEAGHYLDNVKYCGYCHYHYQKLKKDGNIKTIPAFKPIPADNATPEPSPEKITHPKVEGKEKVTKNRSEKKKSPQSGSAHHSHISSLLLATSSDAGASSIINPSVGTMKTSTVTSGLNGSILSPHHRPPSSVKEHPASQALDENSNSSCHLETVCKNEGSNCSNSKIGSKFTTANFTETVITQSGSPVFAAEKQKKKKSAVGDSITASLGPPGATGGFTRSPVSSSMSSPSSSSSMLSGTIGPILVSPPPETVLPATISDATAAAIGGTAASMPSFCAMYETIVNGGASKDSVETITPEISPTKRTKVHPNEKVALKKHRKTTGNRVKLKKGKTNPETEQLNILPPAAKKKRHKEKQSPLPTTPRKKGKIKAVIDTVMASETDHTYYRTVETAAAALTAATTNQPSLSVNLQNGFASHGLSGSLINNDLNEPCPSRDFTLSPAIANSFASLLVPTPKMMNRSGKSPDGIVPPPFPTTLEQLLERQWEQGSQFLMDQAQHFDIAALLSCLHQLQNENQRLEDHVNNLVARRDHLLAVNARLALPLNNTGSFLNHQHHPTSMEGSSVNTDGRGNLRLNCYLPMENGLPHSPQDSSYRKNSPNIVQSLGSSVNNLNGLPLPPSPASSLATNPSPGIGPNLSQASSLPYQTISPPYSTPSPTSSIHVHPINTGLGLPVTIPQPFPTHNNPGGQRTTEER